MLNPRHIRLTDRGIGRSLRQSTRPPPAPPPTLAVALGYVVVRIRRRLHLSQEQLAGRIGLSRSAVSRWEHGNRFPTISHLAMLGDLAGRSASSLLTEAEDMVRSARDAAVPHERDGPDDDHTEDDHAADD